MRHKRSSEVKMKMGCILLLIWVRLKILVWRHEEIQLTPNIVANSKKMVGAVQFINHPCKLMTQMIIPIIYKISLIVNPITPCVMTLSTKILDSQIQDSQIFPKKAYHHTNSLPEKVIIAQSGNTTRQIFKTVIS